MIRGMAQFFVKIMERYLPDPFLFAVILTFVVFLAGLLLTPSTPFQLIDYWAGGLWGILAFTMQICLVLVTGAALVQTPLVTKGLNRLCSVVKTPKAAYAFTVFVSAVASLISWGVGLIVGAFIARQMAKRIQNVHYPLLVAAAYSGFVVWTMGYTSSAALLVATEGHPLEKVIGVIPVTETLLTPFNLVTAVLILIALPILMVFMAPKDDEVKSIDPSLLRDEEAAALEATFQPAPDSWASKVEQLRLLNIIVALAGIIYLVRYFANGGTLDINVVNLTFLVAGLLLSRSPIEYVNNVMEGGKSLGAIVLQFPFYGGIIGLMEQSGLAVIVSEWFTSFATAATMPFWAFISAGVLNIFIPSGGAQWAVQGPIMMDAAVKLGADIPKTIMGVAWGEWTNMIQPFWAIPALAIAGLKAKDIMGYCVLTLIVSGVLFSIGALFL
ncbi:short-chain fatty acid transporter [Brevibacillus marinus]|uniref:short-chain fatty acid transporter n=1 Tax=Brevibacillus marinus TaxID=2496837 RepID=UPI001F49E2BB|nr:TIGR00366 family protein [Brevibacillus marinus]